MGFGCLAPGDQAKFPSRLGGVEIGGRGVEKAGGSVTILGAEAETGEQAPESLIDRAPERAPRGTWNASGGARSFKPMVSAADNSPPTSILGARQG